MDDCEIAEGYLEAGKANRITPQTFQIVCVRNPELADRIRLARGEVVGGILNPRPTPIRLIRPSRRRK